MKSVKEGGGSRGARTRIGHLDFDHSSLKGLPIKVESLLEPVHIGKLDIAETLGAHHLAVLNDSNAGNVAALEEFSDSFHCGVVREVAEVSGVRRLVGDRLGAKIAGRVSWSWSARSLQATKREKTGECKEGSHRSCQDDMLPMGRGLSLGGSGWVPDEESGQDVGRGRQTRSRLHVPVTASLRQRQLQERGQSGVQSHHRFLQPRRPKSLHQSLAAY